MDGMYVGGTIVRLVFIYHHTIPSLSCRPASHYSKTMPTLFTDPRSGGVKKSSGVNVLPIVAEVWTQVRDDSNSDVDWLIASFDGSSKTDITVISSGSGGLEACASSLPENVACYGGIKLKSGRFVTFYYAPEGCSVMVRGRGTPTNVFFVYVLPKFTHVC